MYDGISDAICKKLLLQADLAPSHLSQSSLAAGAAAVKAETHKQTKYAELVSSGEFLFAPIAIESLGVWGPSALSVCAAIGGRITNLTGDLRALSFLKQRLGLAVQKGNAAAVVETHPQGDISANSDSGT